MDWRGGDLGNVDSRDGFWREIAEIEIGGMGIGGDVSLEGM